MQSLAARRYTFFRLGLVTGLGLLILIYAVIAAYADVGPVPVAPPGSNLKTESETSVRMVSESVLLNIRSAALDDQTTLRLLPDTVVWGIEWLPAVADVTADFRLLNQGTASETLKVWFPLSADLKGEPIWVQIADFQVAVNGQPVAFEIVELPNPLGASQPLLSWASFDVTFPPGQEQSIRVAYVLPPQLTPGDTVGMEYAYIFQTGAGWAGTIGQAELVVVLPYPVSEETVGEMPAAGVVTGNQVRWNWTELEPTPEQDFYIHLLQPQHWDVLSAARSAVAGNANDGQAWLALGQVYQSLTHAKGPGFVRSFGSVYQPFGVQAYQEADRLLPGSPAPHAGLAELYLAQLFSARQAIPEDLALVQTELRLAEELLASQPSEAISQQVEQVRARLEIFLEQLGTATLQPPGAEMPSRVSATALTALPVVSDTPSAAAPTTPTLEPTANRQANSPLLLVAGLGILLLGGVLLLVGLGLRGR